MNKFEAINKEFIKSAVKTPDKWTGQKIAKAVFQHLLDYYPKGALETLKNVKEEVDIISHEAGTAFEKIQPGREFYRVGHTMFFPEFSYSADVNWDANLPSVFTKNGWFQTSITTATQFMKKSPAESNVNDIFFSGSGKISLVAEIDDNANIVVIGPARDQFMQCRLYIYESLPPVFGARVSSPGELGGSEVLFSGSKGVKSQIDQVVWDTYWKGAIIGCLKDMAKEGFLHTEDLEEAREILQSKSKSMTGKLHGVVKRSVS